MTSCRGQLANLLTLGELPEGEERIGVNNTHTTSCTYCAPLARFSVYTRGRDPARDPPAKSAISQERPGNMGPTRKIGKRGGRGNGRGIKESLLRMSEFWTRIDANPKRLRDIAR